MTRNMKNLLSYNNKVMYFENAYCLGKVHVDLETSDVHIHGTVTDIVDDGELFFIAAAPPDYHYSFPGSGLPFANPSQAFQNSPNKGMVQLQSNKFSIHLLHPNSYYVGLGSVLIPPTLSLRYKTGGEYKTVNVKIADEVPYRLLSYPKGLNYNRQDATFYKDTEKLPIRSQEALLRDSAYPKTNSPIDNYWGLKPRH